MDRIDTRGNAGDGEISLIVCNHTKRGSYNRYLRLCNWLAEVGIDHLPSDSPKLLAEGGGAQSKTEKHKLDGTSTHRPEWGIKTLFDARHKRLGNLYPKIPDRS